MGGESGPDGKISHSRPVAAANSDSHISKIDYAHIMNLAMSHHSPKGRHHVREVLGIPNNYALLYDRAVGTKVALQKRW